MGQLTLAKFRAKGHNRIMNSPKYYFVLLATGVLLGLAAAPVRAASAEPGPKIIDRLIEAAGAAGFSTPEINSSTGVPQPPANPAADRKRIENENFQSMLFHLALEPVDEAFCDGKLGALNKKNEAEHRACRITRNFLWYIKAKPEGVNGRFPPLVDGLYCRTEAELDELIARLEAALK